MLRPCPRPIAVAERRRAVASLARTVATESATSRRTLKSGAAWLRGPAPIVDAARGDVHGPSSPTSTAQATVLSGFGSPPGQPSDAVVRSSRVRHLVRPMALERTLADRSPTGTTGLSFEQVSASSRAAFDAAPVEPRRCGVRPRLSSVPRSASTTFAATARHLKHVIDPDGSLRQAETDFGRRWLTVAPMLDGMHCRRRCP